MIQRMDVKGVRYTVSDKLQSYINRKLGRLDRYMSRHSQASCHLEVSLHESTGKGPKRCHCDVTLKLPNETIVIKEATVNMFALLYFGAATT